DALITLGFWDGFLGSDHVRASTTLHEFGHNALRGHSGDPFAPFEPNCNPNYLSVMNYLFQVEGVITAGGTPTIDFSRVSLGSVNESGLPAGFGTMDYRTSWYAPRQFVHQSLGTTAAKRHCDGTRLSDAEEADLKAGR